MLQNHSKIDFSMNKSSKFLVDDLYTFRLPNLKPKIYIFEENHLEFQTEQKIKFIFPYRTRFWGKCLSKKYI